MTRRETITPGTYLRKRRENAGVTLPEVARLMANLPMVTKRPSQDDVAKLVARLEASEADRDNITINQALLVRNAFPFDIEVYEHLLWRHYDPATNLPEPQVCRVCACSFHDACEIRLPDSEPLFGQFTAHPGKVGTGFPPGMGGTQTCAWAETDLCTACAPAVELAPQEDALASARQAERELTQGASA